VEKQGDAKARITLQQMRAEAEGREAQGLALVRVKEAEAEAIAKQGRAEADAKRDMLLATATGKEADAVATEKMGMARAVETREKLLAEAQGLEKKADAMAKLDDKSRAHEEYRLQLEQAMRIELERIGMRRDVAQAQAQVLAQAMQSAKINIVGGDGQFFEQFIRAVSLGQALDGVVHNSETTKKLFAGYIDGEKSLTDDIKDVLSRPAISTEGIKNLSVTAALTTLMSNMADGQRVKVENLIEKARELGLK
jgi:hypothetical protein